MHTILDVINEMLEKYVGDECPNCKSKNIIQEHYYEEEYELTCSECGQ